MKLLPFLPIALVFALSASAAEWKITTFAGNGQKGFSGDGGTATLAAKVVIFHSAAEDRKSTRLNSSHQIISYAVFCLKKKKKKELYSLTIHPAILFRLRKQAPPHRISYEIATKT